MASTFRMVKKQQAKCDRHRLFKRFLCYQVLDWGYFPKGVLSFTHSALLGLFSATWIAFQTLYDHIRQQIAHDCEGNPIKRYRTRYESRWSGP